MNNSMHSVWVLISVHSSLFLSIQDGWPPLLAASFLGHVDVVCVLIEAHADVNSQSTVWYSGQPVHRIYAYVIPLHSLTPYAQNDLTALYLSSQTGHIDVVRALIKAGAHVNQRTKVVNSNSICSYAIMHMISFIRLCIFPPSSYLLPVRPFLFFHNANLFSPSLRICSTLAFCMIMTERWRVKGFTIPLLGQWARMQG